MRCGPDSGMIASTELVRTDEPSRLQMPPLRLAQSRYLEGGKWPTLQTGTV